LLERALSAFGIAVGQARVSVQHVIGERKLPDDRLVLRKAALDLAGLDQRARLEVTLPPGAI
jgi:hypothetical protein